MGKSSKYPSFSTGSVTVNGQDKVSTYKNGNNVVSNYNMTEAEKRAYEYAQNSFADSLSKINVFDENTQKELQNQLNAYTLQGQKMINNIYNPMLNDLKNDIASRFGNFDNSIFMDNLNSIEANRAETVSDLAQDVLAKRDELVNNELSQRYDYLSFLMDVQNSTNSNILNFANLSQQNTSAGNTYNSQAYKTQGDYSNLTTGILSTMGSYGKASALALQIANNYL